MPGYVFTGWSSVGAGENALGYQLTVTMNRPMSIYPGFAPATTVNFATVPANLAILADHNSMNTPAQQFWGWNTVHTVGAISPQEDNTGNMWVFSFLERRRNPDARLYRAFHVFAGHAYSHVRPGRRGFLLHFSHRTQPDRRRAQQLAQLRLSLGRRRDAYVFRSGATDRFRGTYLVVRLLVERRARFADAWWRPVTRPAAFVDGHLHTGRTVDH